MKSFNLRASAAAFAALAGLAASAHAVVINETEDNNTKATANPAAMAVGDILSGVTTGTSTTTAGLGSADNFLVSLGAQPIAIYRNRLTITTTGTAGHTGTLRGLTQTAANAGTGVGPGTINAGTDAAVQTSSTATTPARFNQFYTFGRATSLYYRVTGGTATTGTYSSTLTQEVVTPVDLGNFQEGAITITNTGMTSTQDLDLMVLDSNLQPIPGYLNDDFLDGTTVPAGGSTLNALLTRNYAPGIYYLAISNFNTASDLASPSDEGAANASVMDFSGVIANSSTTALASMPFKFVDSSGTFNFTGSKPGAFDVYFAKFTVIPAPGSLALLGLGGLVAARRRRN